MMLLWRPLLGAILTSTLAYGNQEEDRIDRIESLISAFNDSAHLDRLPVIVDWEDGEGEYSSESQVREHFEYADFFFVQLADSSVCETIVWADRESIAKRLIGYEPPRDWYNDTYKVMTVLCPSGKVYRLMKRIRPSGFFDFVNPGPNRGEENYFFILGHVKEASPKA